MIGISNTFYLTYAKCGGVAEEGSEYRCSLKKQTKKTLYTIGITIITKQRK